MLLLHIHVCAFLRVKSEHPKAKASFLLFSVETQNKKPQMAGSVPPAATNQPCVGFPEGQAGKDETSSVPPGLSAGSRPTPTHNRALNRVFHSELNCAGVSHGGASKMSLILPASC